MANLGTDAIIPLDLHPRMTFALQDWWTYQSTSQWSGAGLAVEEPLLIRPPSSGLSDLSYPSAGRLDVKGRHCGLSLAAAARCRVQYCMLLRVDVLLVTGSPLQTTASHTAELAGCAMRQGREWWQQRVLRALADEPHVKRQE